MGDVMRVYGGVIVVAIAILIGGALMAASCGQLLATSTERGRQEENAAVVEAFRVNSQACAQNFNEAVAQSENLLADRSGDTSDPPDLNDRLHSLNHQSVTAARCLIGTVSWMMPGRRDAGRTPVDTQNELLDAVFPQYEGHPPRNLVCREQQQAPVDAQVALNREIVWWAATASRLAGVGEPEIVAAVDTFTEIVDRGFPVSAAGWPVYSGTGRDGAWLTYDPDTTTVTVNPPTEEQVEEYCDTLAEQPVPPSERQIDERLRP